MANAVYAAQAADADWRPVTSSNVAAVGYAADFHRLFVRFHGGATYAYLDVPPDVWQAFMDAPSKGEFVYDVIRGARGRRPCPKDQLDTVYDCRNL